MTLHTIGPAPVGRMTSREQLRCLRRGLPGALRSAYPVDLVLEHLRAEEAAAAQLAVTIRRSGAVVVDWGVRPDLIAPATRRRQRRAEQSFGGPAASFAGVVSTGTAGATVIQGTLAVPDAWTRRAWALALAGLPMGSAFFWLVLSSWTHALLISLAGAVLGIAGYTSVAALSCRQLLGVLERAAGGPFERDAHVDLVAPTLPAERALPPDGSAPAHWPRHDRLRPDDEHDLGGGP